MNNFRHPRYRLLSEYDFTLKRIEFGEWVEYKWTLAAGEECEYFKSADTYVFEARDGVVPFADGEQVESSPSVFAPVRIYVLQGGAENLDSFFKHSLPEYAGYEWYWTVPKGAVVGETGFIYLCQPESRIAGRVEIIGEPFFNTGGHAFPENEVMADKWCARIEFRAYYEPRAELSMKGLRALFSKDWDWLRYPRGNTKLPAAIWKPFFEMTVDTEKVVS